MAFKHAHLPILLKQKHTYWLIPSDIVVTTTEQFHSYSIGIYIYTLSLKPLATVTSYYHLRPIMCPSACTMYPYFRWGFSITYSHQRKTLWIAQIVDKKLINLFGSWPEQREKIIATVKSQQSHAVILTETVVLLWFKMVHISSNGRHSGAIFFKPEKNLEFFRLKNCPRDDYPGKLEWLAVNNLVYFAQKRRLICDCDSFLGCWD